MDEKMNEPIAAAEDGGTVLKRRKKTVGIIAAVAAVAVVAVVAALLTGGSAKSVAGKFAKEYCSANIKSCTKLLAYDYYDYLLSDYDDEEEFFEDASDEYDEEITSWRDYYKAESEDSKDRLDDYYGSYKFTIEVTKEKNMSLKKWEDEYEWEIENYEDADCFDRDAVKAVKMVTVKIKIKGEDGSDSYTAEMCVVKMGLSWKVFDFDL